MLSRLRDNWHWVGLVLGLALGVGDYLLFVALGRPQPAWPGPEITLAFQTALFGVLGYAFGRIAIARRSARRDAQTIERQLRELEEAQQKLVQQEKLAAVGRLAAGVAHEVRNPLGVIRASASMVQESFEPGEDAHRACQFICEESDRLNALITALLTFSRPTEPKLAEVSIEKLLDRAVQLAGEQIRGRSIELQREVRPGAAPTLRADPDLLSQVLLDLLTNAAEAVAEGGRIAVRIDGDPDALRVDVADDGPGVSPEVATQVFEPFVTTKARGSGLGLAMALRIVETHGGRLELREGLGAGRGGAGACFRLELPRGGPAPSAS